MSFLGRIFGGKSSSTVEALVKPASIDSSEGDRSLSGQKSARERLDLFSLIHAASPEAQDTEKIAVDALRSATQIFHLTQL